MSNSTKVTSELLRPATSPSSLRQSFDDWLPASADAWNLSRAWIMAILMAPAFLAASGIVAALAGKKIYKLYTEEDGIAEYLQAGLYGGCWFMALLIVRHHVKAKHYLIAVLYVLLACGLFFMVGEELSWGQRIFGWETPATLQEVNKQEETNLHNIYGVGATFKWVQGLVGAYGAFLPLVFLRSNSFSQHRKLIDAVVPHYTLIAFFLPMFIWRLYRNLWNDPEKFYYVITNYNEVIELILATGFFLFMIFQMRRRSYQCS
jgi:hypothetical protein